MAAEAAARAAQRDAQEARRDAQEARARAEAAEAAAAAETARAALDATLQVGAWPAWKCVGARVLAHIQAHQPPLYMDATLQVGARPALYEYTYVGLATWVGPPGCGIRP